MEEQVSLVDPTIMIGIKRRGGIFAGIKGDAIRFYIKRGSVLDNEENLRILREYMKNKYSYVLKVVIRDM